MSRYTKGFAVFSYVQDEDPDLSGWNMNFNSLSANLDTTRGYMREGDQIRSVKINRIPNIETCRNYDYLGFAFQYAINRKVIVNSIQPTMQDARLRGGEGKLYPVSIISLETIQ